MAVVRNLMVRSGADFSGLYQEMARAQKQLTAFQRGLTGIMKGIGLALGGLAVGKLIKDSINSAMGVESSITQLGRTMGDNAGEFDDWVKTQAKAFGMAREEAYKYGAVYSNLISTFAKGTDETAQYTTQLMKASAVVASATGRTMEDTMERIRSGLLGNTEAIEDLGINVNVAMLESTEAFRQFAKGRSWQQLAFQEQQQIRLMAILEQANTKYGDSLARTTATKQMMFLATLKNIRLNLGQAFLTIYNIVLPILTSLASKLEIVTGALARFMQALFGAKQATKATQAQAGAMEDLGEATEEAGQKAQGALAGFDEINQLDIGGSSTVSAGGATTDSSAELPEIGDAGELSGPMEQVVTKAEEMAAKIRTAFTSFKDAIVGNKDIIVPALGSIAGALAGLALYQTVSELSKQFKVLREVVSVAWTALASNPMLLVVVAIGALIGALVAAYQNNEQFREAVNRLWDRIKTALTPVVERLGAVLSWLWREVITPLASILADVFAIALEVVAKVAESLWKNILVPLGNLLATVFLAAVQGVADIFNVTLKPVIETLIDVFSELWHKVLEPIAWYLAGAFKTAFDTALSGVKEAIGGIKDVFLGLIDFVTGVFTGDWERAWEGVKSVFKGIWDTFGALVKIPLNLVIDAINGVIRGLNRLSINVPSWVPGVGGRTWGVNISEIPHLARGGIIDEPTMALIGESGPEAVVPLENTGFVQAIGDAVASGVASAMAQVLQVMGSGGQLPRELVINLDGTQMARAIIPPLDRERGRIGSTAVIQTV